MKISLIYLPHPYLNDPLAQLPLGILYLAAILEQQKIDVRVDNFSALTEEEAINQLQKAEVFGITVTSLELLQANKFAELIKQKFPKSKVILGGPGTFSSEYVNWEFIDSICQGEGEFTILQMINDILHNSLKTIYHGTLVKNLDILPLPARHLLNTDKLGGYIFANHKTYDKTFRMEFKNKGSATVLSSRGCPFSCYFCASKVVNPVLRFRNPRLVYEEIKHLYDTYKIKTYRFSDEMFTANKEHVKKICELIKPLGLVWRVSARVKPLSLDILRIMRNAGCVEISFGVESFDNDVLKGLNKGTTAEDNYKAICMAKEVGMMVRVLFMIRTPFQSPKTIEENIEWLSKCDYDTIAVTSFVPLPGTPIFNNPEQFGIEILNKNLDDYNFYFYGAGEKNELKDIIKIKNRSLKDLNEESEYFRKWVEDKKINKG